MPEGDGNQTALNSGRKRILGFDTLVAVILFLVFILVVITGIFTYFRLERIVNTVNHGIRPDEKLLVVKEIFNKLSDAENSVKSYSLTRNENYLSRFYEIVRETETDFEALRELTPAEDTMTPYIDSLDQLVGRKFELLDSMLLITDEYRVQQALNKMMRSIEEARSPVTVIVPADTLVGADTVVVDTLPAVEEKKPGFFARLFGKKKEKLEEEEEEPVVERDTIIPKEVEVTEDAPLEKINRQLEQVRSAELARESRLREREWVLIQQDKLVMDKIRQLLSVLESMERNSFQERTLEAENNAQEIKTIIAVFCVAASLLLFLAALTIARYVRNNNRYRQALKVAGDEARELARARERFLANMSHEIRTPMNVISGFTAQLMETEMNSEQKEYLTMVRKSADHLLHILNDILDFSKLEAGKMKLSRSMTELSKLIEDIVDQFKPLAKAKNNLLTCQLDPALPLFIAADEVRLRQILYNLVGNAIKFTDSGEVTISADLHSQKEDKILIRFRVKDTGIGISESDLKNIFTEFEQASVDPGKAGGTGLGLSITRKLVDLHQGEIAISSKKRKGTIVTVVLPFGEWRNEPQSISPKEITPSQALPEGLKILIVDDEEFNRKLLKTVLRKYGCEVQEADGGVPALQMIGEGSFDIVLTDNRMPDMDGKELCRQIRAMEDPVRSKIPVIVITAVVSLQDQEAYREAGMDDFIPKPFEERNLIASISKHTRNQKKKATGRRIPSFGSATSGEQGYDLAELKRLSGDDPQFFKELIDLFIRGTTDGFAILREKLKERDWKAMGGQAHKMSAPSKHLKAEELYRLLKEIESRESMSNDPRQMKEILGQAEKEFLRIRDDIRKKKG